MMEQEEELYNCKLKPAVLQVGIVSGILSTFEEAKRTTSIALDFVKYLIYIHHLSTRACSPKDGERVITKSGNGSRRRRDK